MPVDVGENLIRVRVRQPGEFQEGTFRTITISAKEGIKAVIGRPEGESKTAIQAYLFDKDKWDKDRAVAWVKEHGESPKMLDPLNAKEKEAADALRGKYNLTDSQVGMIAYSYAARRGLIYGLKINKKREVTGIVGATVIDTDGDILPAADILAGIKSGEPKIYVMHNRQVKVGELLDTWQEGELVQVKVLLDDTEDGIKAAQRIESGELRAFSVGFGGWEVEKIPEVQAKLKRNFFVGDISLVDYPANQSAMLLDFKGQELKGYSPFEVIPATSEEIDYKLYQKEVKTMDMDGKFAELQVKNAELAEKNLKLETDLAEKAAKIVEFEAEKRTKVITDTLKSYEGKMLRGELDTLKELMEANSWGEKHAKLFDGVLGRITVPVKPETQLTEAAPDQAEIDERNVLFATLDKNIKGKE